MPKEPEIVEGELQAVESPSTEIVRVLQEGDPDTQVAILERKAQLAGRFKKALGTILLSQTYAEDWQEFDGIMCLSSAGAERVARLFDIQFHEVSSRKEEFADATGKGYRYVFEGWATMGTRRIFAQGVYGTRDKFLGYTGGQWRAVEDINENHIRTAAYHIFLGNGVKGLLGLRGMTRKAYNELMGGTGQDPAKSSKVPFAEGTKGGVSQDDRSKQAELVTICLDLAHAGLTVDRNADGEWEAGPMSDGDDRSDTDRAKAICIKLSSFTGRDGKEVPGLGASQLKGKRLDVTLGTARKVRDGAGIKEEE